MDREHVTNFLLYGRGLYIHHTDAIDSAAKNGHVNVIAWFHKHRSGNITFMYNISTIDRVAKNGHVNILEWFPESGYLFKYTHWAIEQAINQKRSL